VKLDGAGVLATGTEAGTAGAVTLTVRPSARARLRRTGTAEVVVRLSYRNQAGVGGTLRRSFGLVERDQVAEAR
jgi:hypothetical protein